MTKQTTAEELAEQYANTTNSITDVQCPRTVKNPGLYFGFLAGYAAAHPKDTESARVRLLMNELEALKKELHYLKEQG